MSTAMPTSATASPEGSVAARDLSEGAAPPSGPGAFERKELGEHTTAPWKIATLGLCPARYYLGGVAKDPRRKESGFEAQVGTLLHHGIEQCAWLRTWLSVGRNEPLTVEELLKGIDQPTTNKSVEQARRNPEALAEARVLAQKIAKHVDLAGMVVESVGTKLKPLVEEPWTLDVGEVDGKRVVVGGIWDFVRRRKGKIVIVDWKKGGDVRGSDELRLDPAATLYAAAAKARWPKETVRVEHFYLTKGFASGIDWTPELDEWARMAALEFARASVAFDRAGTWPATPSLRACSFCNFRPTCTAFRERVTNGFELGAFDPSVFADLEKATLARARAHEGVKLAEKWVEDLDQALDAAIVRAAEYGHDEIVIAGHVVRRGKRTSHRFSMWRHTIKRLWELTGIAPEEAEDALLSFQVGAVSELLASRGYAQEERERIVEVLKHETAEERSATWVEVRAVADPMPTVDVARILATGTRMKLPPPAPDAPPAATPPAELATAHAAPSAGAPAGGVSLPASAPAAAGPTVAGPTVTQEPLTHATAAIALARQEERPGVVSKIVTELTPPYGTEKPAPVERAEDPKASVGFTPAALGHVCACGKGFQNSRGLSGHRRSCATAKAKAAAPIFPEGKA